MLLSFRKAGNIFGWVPVKFSLGTLLLFYFDHDPWEGTAHGTVEGSQNMDSRKLPKQHLVQLRFTLQPVN